MANNWAIVIGINQYRFLQPLKYAKRDAEVMNAFLREEANFNRIFLFTDDSPSIGGKPTEPFRANLLRVLRQIFKEPFMQDGDNFWFFFSGHGIRHQEQDYLMPLDGDPEDVENTGIATTTITHYLRSCGADNVVMLLDACRSGGKKSGEGIGRQTEATARQTGVISIFSCSPDQYSYELEAIEHGAFTSVLLEGLSIRGKCATVERLNQYLQSQVPSLVQQHLRSARQVPYTIAEPLERSHLILMPQHASLIDIAMLKNDAYRAQTKQHWELAQRLWIRILAAASGQDTEAIEALQTLAVLRTSSAQLQPATEAEPADERGWSRTRKSAPSTVFTSQDYQDRQVILSKVHNFWIKGVLDNSLHNRIILELGLEERPEAIAHPWPFVWESTQTRRHLVRTGIPAIALFDELGAGATLLILGAPGSGKTITLLQITRELLARADANPTHAIPVVFNLSSWAGQPLDIWLAKELSSGYQLPQSMGRRWLESQTLTLMLDGLDEVAESRREDCIKALNQFNQTYRRIEIVVCSRLGDYEALTHRLQFQGAIFIQPLTDEQIEQYWAQTGEALVGVQEVLSQNETLRELVKSPLVLSLMTIAYQGLPASELRHLLLAENPTQPLFQLYIKRMLARQQHFQPYNNHQTQKWLKWLALGMFLNAQSIFSLEQMQPNLFQNRLQLWIYRLGVGLTLGIGYGFLFGFIYRSIITLPFSGAISLPFLDTTFLEEMGWRLIFLSILTYHSIALTLSPWIGMAIGVIGTLPAALLGHLDEIRPVESLEWSWSRTRWISLGGAVSGYLFWLFLGETGVGFVLSLSISLLFGIGWVKRSAPSKTIPNEGIWRSAAIASSLIWLVDISILLQLWSFMMYSSQFQFFMHGLGFGFAIGLLAILRSNLVIAGVATVQHLILRIVLWVNGYTPRNYTQFLRYAARCALMQQVGSGYIFLHRLLLEYLALEEFPTQR